MYGFSRTRFEEYCGSDDYNLTGVSKPVSASRNSGNVVASGEMTIQEFRRGVRRNKAHYVDSNDDKYFNWWNRGFAATAYMHHTHLVLNEKYVPKTPDKIEVFQEIQTFMYAVMEEKLKSEKGELLISEFEEKRNVQSIYCKLKKHALGSTAAQLSGDTLLQNITTAQYLGTWRVDLFNFVLNWKEQVMKYKKLELEEFPPKQKLHMIQNAFGEVVSWLVSNRLGIKILLKAIRGL
jgi:hypothetical protein